MTADLSFKDSALLQVEVFNHTGYAGYQHVSFY